MRLSDTCIVIPREPQRIRLGILREAIWYVTTLDSGQGALPYPSFCRTTQTNSKNDRDDLARVADQRFGGWVERPFTALLYTAQRVCCARESPMDHWLKSSWEGFESGLPRKLNWLAK